MNFLPQVAAAIAPPVAGALGQMAGVAAGNTAGQAANMGQNTDSVWDTLKKSGVTLDPAQQAALQNHFAREANQDSLNQQMQGGAFLAQVGNQAQNLNTQRQMAINSQENAAQNATNQLGALRDRASSGAQAINNAMNVVSGLYR